MRLLAILVALAAAGPAGAGPAAAVQDDYPRALAEARARSVPLLVDVWAPW